MEPERGTASERPAARAKGLGVDGAMDPVDTDGSTGEGEQAGEKGKVSLQDGETGVGTGGRDRRSM